MLKSIIRKLNKIKNEEDSEEVNDYENIPKKSCFILIYNCGRTDLLDVNLYSILNSNGSYIIIYDSEINLDNYIINTENKETLKEENKNLQPLENADNDLQSLKILDNKYILLNKKKYFYFDIYVSEEILTKKRFYIQVWKDEKLLKLRKIFIMEDTIESLNIIKNIKSPYILGYIDKGKGRISLNNVNSEVRSYIVFEYCSEYNLLDFIEIQKFSEIHSKLIFYKILQGIKTIHEANICHRDINPENISLDKNYNPKIFGLHYLCQNKENLKDYLVDRRYCAPEILLNVPYNGIKCDIFSLGQLLFNLVTGLLGFNSSSEKDEYYLLIRGKNYKSYWKFFESNYKLILSESFKDLFIRMVSYNPEERPSIEEILNSEWLEEIKNLSEENMKEIENQIEEEFKKREIDIRDKNKEILKEEDNSSFR